MTNDVLAEVEGRADQAFATYTKEAEAIRRDPNLSPQGKAAALAEAAARHDTIFPALEDDARRRVARRLADVVAEEKGLLAAAAKGDRDLLGQSNPVAVALAEREIAAAADDEIVAYVEASRDDVDWQINGRLAAAEFKRRRRERPRDKALATEESRLKQLEAPPDPKLQALRDERLDLEKSGWRVEKLNRRVEAERISTLIR